MKIHGISEDYWEVGVYGVENTENEATSPFQAINAMLMITEVTISCVPIMCHSA